MPMQHAHFRAPRLGGGDKTQPTARGMATHMLLQYIDYEKTGTEQEMREELCATDRSALFKRPSGRGRRYRQHTAPVFLASRQAHNVGRCAKARV